MMNEELILYRLNELKEGQEHLMDEFDRLQKDVSELKTKAATWGAIAGAVGTWVTTFLFKVFWK